MEDKIFDMGIMANVNKNSREFDLALLEELKTLNNISAEKFDTVVKKIMKKKSSCTLWWDNKTVNEWNGSGKVIDSDGDIRYIPPTRYQKGKAQAIATAQEWQQEASTTAQSWSELYEAQRHFAKLAKRYGLIKDFRENGII